MESELQAELARCPLCDTLGPNTKFCLSCGAEKSLEDSEAQFQDDLVHSLDETVGDLDEAVDEVEEPVGDLEEQEEMEDEPIPDEPVEPELVDLDYEIDSKVKENMLDLKKGVDLIIWLVDRYLKGNVEEEHFLQFLDAYEYRLDQCFKHRSLMLEISRDMKPIQTALNWAKLNLAEFERKMKIRDISDEEYKLKVPVYKWDIEKYERENAKRKSEIKLLENITQVMPKEEVDELKEMAKNSQKSVEELNKSGDISPETVTRTKEILKKALDAMKNPKKTRDSGFDRSI